MHLVIVVVVHGTQTMVIEVDLEDQVAVDTLDLFKLKDQAELVITEVIHHQKEILVDQVDLLETLAVAVAAELVLLEEIIVELLVELVEME